MISGTLTGRVFARVIPCVSVAEYFYYRDQSTNPSRFGIFTRGNVCAFNSAFSPIDTFQPRK